MGRSVTFGQKDEELIKCIEQYQKENKLNYFIDAVRKLCDIGLKAEDLMRTSKNN